jgi:hypothetical protein
MAKVKPKKKPAKRVEFVVDDAMIERIHSLEEAICPRVAARLTALERQNGMAMKREEAIYARLATLESPQRPTGVRTAEGYSRLMADLFKDAPARPANHLSANDRWLVNNMVAIAGSRLTRLARHELIQRLQALNDPG